MRKFIALCLSLLILFSLSLPAFAAADGSEALAQGLAYLRGDGVAQDFEKALQIFLAAERDGDTSVLFPIGQMYEHGQGTKKNLVKAVEYYQSAMRAGSAEAEEKLRQEPLRSVAEAVSVQTQATTQVTGEYAEPEYIRGNTYPFYLNRPVIDLENIILVLTLEDWLSGWPFGNWYVYVRDSRGNWHHTALFDLDNRLVGPGQTITYNLRLDGPETFTALALCPADKGMDYVVRLSPIFIVPEKNVGEYSSGLIRPSYTPIDPSQMGPLTNHIPTTAYKVPTAPGFGYAIDDGGKDYGDAVPGTKDGIYDDWFWNYELR